MLRVVWKPDIARLLSSSSPPDSTAALSDYISKFASSLRSESESESAAAYPAETIPLLAVLDLVAHTNPQPRILNLLPNGTSEHHHHHHHHLESFLRLDKKPSEFRLARACVSAVLDDTGVKFVAHHGEPSSETRGFNVSLLPSAQWNGNNLRTYSVLLKERSDNLLAKDVLVVGHGLGVDKRVA